MRKHLAIFGLAAVTAFTLLTWAVMRSGQAATEVEPNSRQHLAERVARFDPERGMTQAEVRKVLGEPQRTDDGTWRYYPFLADHGEQRNRLNLTFDGEVLVEWEWQAP
jgi:outer membrane protein assembly factor BamE (lipoprotein component of BamABCDE complex)